MPTWRSTASGQLVTGGSTTRANLDAATGDTRQFLGDRRSHQKP